MFNTIGIVTKPHDQNSKQTAIELSAFIEGLGVTVVTGTNKIAEQSDLVIVVGGDGSLLNTARTFVDKNIPILGINLGRLGFLADVSVNSMFDIVTEILSGEFTKEERCLLSCQIEKEGDLLNSNLALNDVVLHRKDVLRMIEFEIYIDDKFVNTQRADGIIVTTPTGSTAYSLSSGGPIMHPGVNAIGLVSICPHTMSHRPLLIPGDRDIVIRIREAKDGASVSFDGQNSYDIEPGEDIRVRQHDNFVHLLHPKNYDYFEIVRSKLHWSKEL
ncbi:MAG TPA: NAD(+) kinase [Candidatus Thioglobus sp.]|jgi:NAD+ kinase|nr:NAD(+) kinase [Candidatus Thioglobus sp.]HIL43312.1 NAD(+) kinase [Gammaproteobacteria bacterium]